MNDLTEQPAAAGMSASARQVLLIALVGEVVAQSGDAVSAAILERAMLGYLVAAAGQENAAAGLEGVSETAGQAVAGDDATTGDVEAASGTVPRAAGVGVPRRVEVRGGSGLQAVRDDPQATSPAGASSNLPRGADGSAKQQDRVPARDVQPRQNHEQRPVMEPTRNMEPKQEIEAKHSVAPWVWRVVWGAVVVAVIGAGVALWWWLQPVKLGEAFVSGNGRIEAVEIDVASKSAGRVTAVLADEGDFVSAGQVIAQMDSSVLAAQKQEALARLEQSQSAVETAMSQVLLRESERGAAQAVVLQREAELDVARKRSARSETLSLEGATSIQELDDDRARVESASAAIAAARAQVAAGDAAIATAQSQVLGARASVLAVAATVDRLTADMDDLVLRAPRDGRVQYRVTETGEVIGAGGKVLNMIDVSDVYLTFFVAEKVAGRVAIGSEVHLVLDAAPQYVIPASVTYVASTAQFTPKTVETASERQKLMFKVKANIDRDLLAKHLKLVKTGLPGVAWLKLDPDVAWPPSLEIKVPQ